MPYSGGQTKLDIIEAVNNKLVVQAFTLLNKIQPLTIAQQNELKAVFSLFSDEQFEKLNIRIEKINDNKRRKNIQKMIKKKREYL